MATLSVVPGHIRLFEGVESRQVPRLASNVRSISSVPVRAIDTDSSPAQPTTFLRTESEGARFMQIVQEAARVNSHRELYQLLQGDIQHFLPHQILISAWGDFNAPGLTLDVVSPLPGVRTESFSRYGFEPALKACFERFVGAGRRPLQLSGRELDFSRYAAVDCPVRDVLRSMQSLQIFGLRNERDNQDTLYVVFNPEAPSAVSTQANVNEYHAFLIDSVIAQIDVAFRRVAALKIPSAANEPCMRIPANLSSREIDVLTWLTQGKTNVEIAQMLNISAHTVKNHAHRIFKKLKVTNRTEVAALLGIPTSGTRGAPAR